jgi:hypothetical protein
MIDRDTLGHEWHYMRCQRCGVWKHSGEAHLACEGERHETVESSWTPVLPMAIFGDNPSLNTGITLPAIHEDPIAAPSFQETAFAGGESGGGGSGSDFSSSMVAEAASEPDTSASSDFSSSSDSSSSDSSSSDFGSGGGTDPSF